MSSGLLLVVGGYCIVDLVLTPALVSLVFVLEIFPERAREAAAARFRSTERILAYWVPAVPSETA